MALNTTTTKNTTPTTKDLAAEPWDLVLPLDAQEDVQLSVEPSQTVLLAKLEFAGATRLAHLEGDGCGIRGVRDKLREFYGDAAADGDLFDGGGDDLVPLETDDDVKTLAIKEVCKILAVAKAGERPSAEDLAEQIAATTIDATGTDALTKDIAAATIDSDDDDTIMKEIERVETAFEAAAAAFEAKGVAVTAAQVERICRILQLRPLRLVAYDLAPEAAVDPEEGRRPLSFDGETVVATDEEDPLVAALAARGVDLDGPTIHKVLEALDIGRRRFVRLGLVEEVAVFEHASEYLKKTSDLDATAAQLKRFSEILRLRPLRFVAYGLAPKSALAAEPEGGHQQLSFDGEVATTDDAEQDPLVGALTARGCDLDGPTIHKILDALEIGKQRFVRFGLVAGGDEEGAAPWAGKRGRRGGDCGGWGGKRHRRHGPKGGDWGGRPGRKGPRGPGGGGGWRGWGRSWGNWLHYNKDFMHYKKDFAHYKMTKAKDLEAQEAVPIKAQEAEPIKAQPLPALEK